ncbi:N-acetylmuramoyl-L-alanine amidase [Maribius pontilimi]|uniref:N-acetylmuramoyl-L-alanine amidase n=1 Tax=Palleronia pontilimi TaxID=1964209 RepID=A0A934IJV7_9RHOB|nr:N-acetylmuramoyl-L-alanine amidase [Palleronia pontilimi]MBJ3763895.1 N-acetylmuramoyl-L-alanine amidase [Palleronia pontilimi]
MVVLHYTAMPTAQGALDRLCDPSVEVSAHYLVCRRGQVVQMVDEAMRAWHAGAGSWGAVRDVNSRSIGIELDNDGASPFPEPQMRALEDLIASTCERWDIPPARVIGHSDCAPGRKIDPGPRFDWARLARRDLAVAARPERAGDTCFADDMRRAGYTATDDPDTLRDALRLRHRPGATGPLDAVDRGLARALARRFPVDAADAGS